MIADVLTYAANNGILDSALTLAAVGRSRPGVGFIAKADPRAFMLPNDEMPPMDPPIGGQVTEERTFDMLGFGAQHPGAAEYFVVAGFATVVSAVHRLSITDPRGPLGWPACALLPPGSADLRRSLPPPAAEGLVARPYYDKSPSIEGALRRTVRIALPFLNLVAFRLDPKGGGCAGSFLLSAERSGSEDLAWFSASMALLMPPPGLGRWRVFAFAGDASAAPFDVTIA